MARSLAKTEWLRDGEPADRGQALEVDQVEMEGDIVKRHGSAGAWMMGVLVWGRDFFGRFPTQW